MASELSGIFRGLSDFPQKMLGGMQTGGQLSFLYPLLQDINSNPQGSSMAQLAAAGLIPGGIFQSVLNPFERLKDPLVSSQNPFDALFGIGRPGLGATLSQAPGSRLPQTPPGSSALDEPGAEGQMDLATPPDVSGPRGQAPPVSTGTSMDPSGLQPGQ